MPATSLKRLQPQPLKPEQIKKLRSLGVTTAEELIALGAVRGNKKRLADYLEISTSQLGRALAKVRSQLDPKVVAEMQRPTPGGPRHGVLDRLLEDKRRSR